MVICCRFDPLIQTWQSLMAFLKPTKTQNLQKTWRHRIIDPPHNHINSNNSRKSQLSNGESKPLISNGEVKGIQPAKMEIHPKNIHMDLKLSNDERRHDLLGIEADSELSCSAGAPAPSHSARAYAECLYREEILEDMWDIHSIVNLYEEREDILVVLPATLYDDDPTFVAVLMPT